MKQIGKAVVFFMVLLLLLGLAGCAEPSVSSSVPAPSSQSEPEIEPYIIEPLETPTNGGMTYEEYFSIERELKPCQETVAKQERYYMTAYGKIFITQQDISLEREGELVLLYRQPMAISHVTVDEDWIMWIARPQNGGYASIYRIYLPTMHYECLYSSFELMGFRCLSSTDIRLIEHRQVGIGGQVQQAATVYSLLTGRFYIVEDQEDDAKVREAYLPQRDLDMGLPSGGQSVLIGTRDLIIGSKNPALYQKYLSRERAETRTTQYGGWRTVGSKIYENGTGKLILEFRDDIRAAFITEEAIYFISGATLYRYHPSSQTIDVLCREVGDCDSIRPITNYIVELYMLNPRYGEQGEEEEMIYRYYDLLSHYSVPIPKDVRIEDKLQELEE